MKVFKFGGASINSLDRIKNVGAIVSYYEKEQLVLVISAMGKTTNALEKVVLSYYEKNLSNALQLFDVIKNQHITLAKYLLVQQFNPCLEQLNDFFTEVEWLLHDKPVRPYDYYYDQIVCIGELLSSTILSHYLKEIKIPNNWLDVRDLIRTDNNFRNAGIDWSFTSNKIQAAIPQTNNSIVVTQGFIGATEDNESTTLGREGSDYTAAVFAYVLDATDLTIWKDVEGVMNADPKLFPDAKLIQELSYREVIEMAFYGAQVIHPKTIKPLQNKGINLWVKCFLDPNLPGTLIQQKATKHLPPIIIIKENQVLLQIESQDYSFVGEKLLAELYDLFAQVRLSPTIIQTGAIAVQVCFDDYHDKIEKIALLAASKFNIQVEKNLTLLTIRHFTPSVFEKFKAEKEMVLLQQTKETVQVLYKD